MSAGVYNQFKLVETAQTFNLSINYDQIELTGASIRSSTPLYRNYGLIVASDTPTFVYGVKADVGTTDGFLVLPITTNSTEFMIAGWRYDDVYVAVFAWIKKIAGETCAEHRQLDTAWSYRLIVTFYYVCNFRWRPKLVNLPPQCDE